MTREVKFILLVFCIYAICVSGCSSKKHFEPQAINGKVVFKDTLSAPIKSATREGAILKDNTLVSFSQGITPLVLEPYHKFLAQDKDIYVLQSRCENIIILESNKHTSQSIPFDTCVLSASLKGDKLAMVLLDNTIMYYDIAQKKEIFSQKYPAVLAINTYLASPQINDKYVIFPDLEGKVLIYDIAQNKITKDILIVSDKFFNNVIYIYAQNNYLLAATTKRVSVIIGDRSFKYDVDLRDVLFFNDKVYVLSIEGEILELDHTLKLLRKVRLPFAVFSGIVIANNTLYTLEKGGYLIELNLKDFAPLVYKNNLAKKKSLFYNQDTFFYDKVYKRFQ